MKIIPVLKSLLVFLLTIFFVACSLPANITVTNCQFTPGDSYKIGQILFRNLGHTGARYGEMTLPRRRLLDTGMGDTITIDYMVHEPAVAGPSAIVVLIGGGNLDTRIERGPGDTVSSTGGNFLVRSAPLFLATSPILIRIITIDRPSDYNDDIQGMSEGYLYDGYRTSMRHTVDLSAVINAENPENLPVFIAGTSRGATSTVANYMLAAAVSLSSPASSGVNGRPVFEGSAYPEVRPSRVTVPAHVIAHLADACPRSTPADSLGILLNLPDGTGDGVFGGIIGTGMPRICGAFHYHGYLGIETCAVERMTSWMGDTFSSIPSTRPVSAAITGITTMPDMAIEIDLLPAITTPTPALMTFALPHLSTSLGGTISLAGSLVTYSPPAGLSNKIDTFVYVVNETGGGSSHQVVSVQIL